MNIQWFPGHMTKALRQMEEDIKLIDLVIELFDARVALSCTNPTIDKLAANKMRLVLLNKADLADKYVTDTFYEYFKNKGYYVLCLDSRENSMMSKVNKMLDEIYQVKREKDLKRGIKNRPIRAMVVGIPNVGKSTFINSFSKKAAAKTGNKPGVTKGKQWIKASKSVELLDTPGVLWPKFEEESIGINLALVGSINDNIIETNELAVELINIMKELYPGKLAERYDIDETIASPDLLVEIAKSRNFLIKGNEYDYNKAAVVLIDEFRKGTLGKISLDRL